MGLDFRDLFVVCSGHVLCFFFFACVVSQEHSLFLEVLLAVADGDLGGFRPGISESADQDKQAADNAEVLEGLDLVRDWRLRRVLDVHVLAHRDNDEQHREHERAESAAQVDDDHDGARDHDAADGLHEHGGLLLGELEPGDVLGDAGLLDEGREVALHDLRHKGLGLLDLEHAGVEAQRNKKDASKQAEEGHLVFSGVDVGFFLFKKRFFLDKEQCVLFLSVESENLGE